MIPLLAAALVLVVCESPRAVDGDTLDCGSERVRLWGIDAEEMSAPGGPAAKEALRGLVTGRRVVCYRPPSGQVRDRYRRTVALCRVGGKDVAEVMVSGGFAKDYSVFSNGYYSNGNR